MCSGPCVRGRDGLVDADSLDHCSFRLLGVLLRVHGRDGHAPPRFPPFLFLLLRYLLGCLSAVRSRWIRQRPVHVQRPRLSRARSRRNGIGTRVWPTHHLPAYPSQSRSSGAVACRRYGGVLLGHLHRVPAITRIADPVGTVASWRRGTGGPPRPLLGDEGVYGGGRRRPARVLLAAAGTHRLLRVVCRGLHLLLGEEPTSRGCSAVLDHLRWACRCVPSRRSEASGCEALRGAAPLPLQLYACSAPVAHLGDRSLDSLGERAVRWRRVWDRV